MDHGGRIAQRPVAWHTTEVEHENVQSAVASQV